MQSKMLSTIYPTNLEVNLTVATQHRTGTLNLLVMCLCGKGQLWPKPHTKPNWANLELINLKTGLSRDLFLGRGPPREVDGMEGAFILLGFICYFQNKISIRERQYASTLLGWLKFVDRLTLQFTRPNPVIGKHTPNFYRNSVNNKPITYSSSIFFNPR